MFKILILILFFYLLHFLLKRENKGVRITLFTYFTLLSITFAVGLISISSTYQLSYSPLDGGFQKLMSWVSLFGYLFLVPTILLGAFKLYKFSFVRFHTVAARFVMFVVMLGALVAVGYVGYIMFILTFYGFAP